MWVSLALGHGHRVKPTSRSLDTMVDQVRSRFWEAVELHEVGVHRDRVSAAADRVVAAHSEALNRLGR